MGGVGGGILGVDEQLANGVRNVLALILSGRIVGGGGGVVVVVGPIIALIGACSLLRLFVGFWKGS